MGAQFARLLRSVVLCLPLSVMAGTQSWQVPSGEWDVSGNWSGSVVPTSADDAIVANGGTALLGTGVAAAAGTVTVGTGSSALQIDGGSLNVDGQVAVGSTLSTGGSITVNSGTISAGGAGIAFYRSVLNFRGGALSAYNLYFNNYDNAVPASEISGGVLSPTRFSTDGGAVVNFSNALMATQLTTVTGGGSAGSTLTVSSGTWQSSSTLDVWGVASSTMTVTGGLVDAGITRIGFLGTTKGTLNISGGLFKAGSMTIGVDSSSIGQTNLSSGTMQVSGDLVVGSQGAGTLNLTGGLITVNGVSSVGDQFLGNSVANVSSGTWQTGVALFVGYGPSAYGELNINGGLVTANSSVLSTAGNAVANVRGGVWQTSGTMSLGYQGSATVNVSGGLASSQMVVFGSGSSGAGTVRVTGSAGGRGVMQAGVFQKGPGAGTLILDGGVLRANGSTDDWLSGFASSDVQILSGGMWVDPNGAAVRIRLALSGSGGLTVDGAGMLTLSGTNSFAGGTTVRSGTLAIASGVEVNHAGGDVTVGDDGTSRAELAISGGVVRGASGVIGNGASSQGVVGVSSGTWSTASGLTVGSSGTGTLTVTGAGVVNVDGGAGVVVLGENSGGVGTLNLGNGGVAGRLEAAGVAAYSGTGLVNFNHTGTYEFAQVLAGRLAVEKWGSGTTTLSGTNGYIGGTVIHEGMILMTDVGPYSALGAGDVSVMEDGGLGGDGTVLGSLSVDGELAPGGATGQMHVTGLLNLYSTAVVTMDLSSLNDFDQITVDGLIFWGGTLSLTLTGDYRPQVNDTFALFTGGTGVGVTTFDDIAFNVAGYAGEMDYDTGVLTITQVPEPGVWALVGLGGAVVMRLRRRIV